MRRVRSQSLSHSLPPPFCDRGKVSVLQFPHLKWGTVRHLLKVNTGKALRNMPGRESLPQSVSYASSKALIVITS